jgi:hypothetical protein
MPTISHEGLLILEGLAAAWLLVLLALVAVLCFGKKHWPAFEFHWGSLGRGLGGWNMSWSLVLAVGWLMLTFGAVMVAMALVTPPSPQNQSPAESKTQGNSGKQESPAPASGKQDLPKPDASKPASGATTTSKKGA